MKLINRNASLMRFHFFLNRTVYTLFHLDKTHLLFFFIILCHVIKKFFAMAPHLLKMKLPLDIASLLKLLQYYLRPMETINFDFLQIMSYSKNYINSKINIL
jgi:hypothetical protein